MTLITDLLTRDTDRVANGDHVRQLWVWPNDIRRPDYLELTRELVLLSWGLGVFLDVDPGRASANRYASIPHRVTLTLQVGPLSLALTASWAAQDRTGGA